MSFVLKDVTTLKSKIKIVQQFIIFGNKNVHSCWVAK